MPVIQLIRNEDISYDRSSTESAGNSLCSLTSVLSSLPPELAQPGSPELDPALCNDGRPVRSEPLTGDVDRTGLNYSMFRNCKPPEPVGGATDDGVDLAFVEEPQTSPLVGQDGAGVVERKLFRKKDEFGAKLSPLPLPRLSSVDTSQSSSSASVNSQSATPVSLPYFTSPLKETPRPAQSGNSIPLQLSTPPITPVRNGRVSYTAQQDDTSPGNQGTHAVSSSFLGTLSTRRPVLTSSFRRPLGSSAQLEAIAGPGYRAGGVNIAGSRKR